MDYETWQEWQAELEATEQRLKAELEQARSRHEAARSEFNIRSADARQIGLNTSDGAFALRKAMQEYNTCLAEYRRALTRFNDFTLRRQFPSDQHQRSCRHRRKIFLRNLPDNQSAWQCLKCGKPFLERFSVGKG
jgi:hypothetical protein